MSVDHNLLRQRVDQFKITGLPGQPASMHMETYFLIDDLWSEVLRLRKELEQKK